MIDLTRPLPLQRKLLRALDEGHTNIVLVAPVRSGKSLGCAQAQLHEVIQYPDDNHAICGVSHGSIRRNIEGYFRELASLYGLSFKSVHGDDPHYLIGGRTKVYLFGGDNVRSQTKIQGLTARSIFIDEASKLHGEFIDVTGTRAGANGLIRIFSTNADSPFCAFAERFIETPPEGTAYFTATFDENFHIPEDVRKQIKANLTPGSFMYRRLVENAWAPAEGLCIPIAPEHIIPAAEADASYPGYGRIGIDPGASGVTAGLYLWKRDDGVWICGDEYWWPRELQGQLSDAAHFQNMLDKGWRPQISVLDPIVGWNMQSVIMDRGYEATLAPVIKVADGIHLITNALAQGRLLISDRCRNLLRTASAYVWQKRSDNPVKENDHACDALRFVVSYTLPAELFQLVA